MLVASPLLSKLKLAQNAREHVEESDGAKENNLSIILGKNKEGSGNFNNYLDLLLQSYKENDKGRQRDREIPRSFRKPSSSFEDFDGELFYDEDYYDYQGGDGDRQRFSNRFRFLYEDDSDISFAVKQSRQLERSLRRFLSKLDKF